MSQEGVRIYFERIAAAKGGGKERDACGTENRGRFSFFSGDSGFPGG